MDIIGSMEGVGAYKRFMLVLIDISQWIISELVHCTTTTILIEFLKDDFIREGIPSTDNGVQFTSKILSS